MKYILKIKGVVGKYQTPKEGECEVLMLSQNENNDYVYKIIEKFSFHKVLFSETQTEFRTYKDLKECENARKEHYKKEDEEFNPMTDVREFNDRSYIKEERFFHVKESQITIISD